MGRGAKTGDGRGLALLLLSTVAYGAMPILAKVAYGSGVRPIPLLAWRFLLASLLFALLRSGPAPPISGRQRLTLWAIGCVFVVNALCYFKALETVPASTVALLLYTYPVIVTLFSGLLGWEALTPRGLGSAGLAVAGGPPTPGGALALGPRSLPSLLPPLPYPTSTTPGS